MANSMRQEFWFLETGLLTLVLTYVRWAKVNVASFNVDSFMRAVVNAATCAGLIVSDAEVTLHYERADADFTRPLGCAGDPNGKEGKYGYRMVASHLYERVLNDSRITEGNYDDDDTSDLPTLHVDTMTVDESHVDDDSIVANEPQRMTYVALVDVLARHDAKGRTKYARIAQAVSEVEWNDERNQPNMVQLAKAMGVKRATAQESYKRFMAFMLSEAFHQIVDEYATIAR